MQTGVAMAVMAAPQSLIAAMAARAGRDLRRSDEASMLFPVSD
jgi:hypothetical protein